MVCYGHIRTDIVTIRRLSTGLGTREIAFRFQLCTFPRPTINQQGGHEAGLLPKTWAHVMSPRGATVQTKPHLAKAGQSGQVAMCNFAKIG